MGPLYRDSRKPRKSDPTKQTIKYLSLAKDPRVQRAVLNSANDSVYKSICNAFFNLAENPEVVLSSGDRKILQKQRPVVQKLVSHSIPIRKKRKLIQKGSGVFLSAVLPAVLSTALSLFGSAFLDKGRK